MNRTRWYFCVIRNVTQRRFIPHANGTVAWEFVSNKRIVAEKEKERKKKRDTQEAFQVGDANDGEGEKERVGEKAVDEIWVALRRVWLENSVKFSTPANRMPGHSWQPSLSWSLLSDSQFLLLLSFPGCRIFCLCVRPVGNPPKRDGGNCFTRREGRFTNSQKVKGRLLRLRRDRSETFLVLRYNLQFV